MQVQQQVFRGEKHWKNPYLSFNGSPITIEQIYEVDTITLEELIQQYESQPFHRNKIVSQINQDPTNLQITSKFTHISTRQLKKWYQLAKIQLEERKKIQDFAFKLIEQQFQPSDISFEFQPRLNQLISLSKTHVNLEQNCLQKKVSSHEIENALKSKEQISLKLPPIKDFKLQRGTKNSSQNSTQNREKAKPHQKPNSIVCAPNRNTKSRSNLISIISEHEKQELQKQENQSSNSNINRTKTIETQSSHQVLQKDVKILSKKDFLQMMKIKLNQGTSRDYRTGGFIKQQPKTIENKSTKKLGPKEDQKSKITKRQIVQSKIKTKSVYVNSTKKIDNPSNLSIGNSSTVSRITQGTQNLSSRYKNNSNYTSRQQPKRKGSMKKIENQKYKSRANTVSRNTIKSQNAQNLKLITQFNVFDSTKTQDCKTVQNKEKRLDFHNKSNQNDDKNMEDKYRIPKVHSQKLLTNVKETEQSNKQAKLQETSNKTIKAKQDLQSMEKSSLKSQIEKTQIYETALIQENQNPVQIFIENEDVYDDEPEVLQKIIILQKEHLNTQLQFTSPDTQENSSLESDHEVKQKDITPSENHPIESENLQISSQIKEQDLSDVKSQTNNKQSCLMTTETNFFQSKNHDLNQNLNRTTHLSSNNHPKSNSVSVGNATNLSKIDKIPLVNIHSNYPKYHLQFPTFSHLFHHIKVHDTKANKAFSLPHLLKSLEFSLQTYFHKQVSKIAKNQMENKITFLNTNSINLPQNNQNSNPNLEIKCISQLQFLGTDQGQSIFDIDLSSFKVKSMDLIRKLRNLDFPSALPMKNQPKNSLKQKQMDPLFYRVVRNKPEVYDIINTSFYRTKNWLQLPHGMELQACWNLLWTWSKPQIDFNSLIKFQKVNHFPGSKELARKDLLKKNIQKIKKLSKKLNDYFDIIPDTYFLPGQNIAFIKKFREAQRQLNNLWILKPVGLSRGRGISLVSKLEQVVFSEPIVMQKYLHNPFLLDGYKFDLRIYVLVTSINPLQCFVYKEGFARVSTQRYCNDLQQIGNKYIHLTNYSIQKDSVKSPDIFTPRQQELGGCKLTLKMLKNRLQLKGIEWEPIWTQIQQVILKSLISCMKYIPQNPNCFQLFGYDIMLDSNLKCWLIQVNSSPSLEQDFLIDQIIKQQLVNDTIQVVEPIDFNREELLKVIERRRKEAEGLKSHVNYSNNSIDQLNQDLFHICNGKILRNYGQVKQHPNFKCIAPGIQYEKILKTVQHYTHDPFVKEENFY